eukprot:5827376-Prymnesium_polylepis.4
MARTPPAVARIETGGVASSVAPAICGRDERARECEHVKLNVLTSVWHVALRKLGGKTKCRRPSCFSRCPARRPR